MITFSCYIFYRYSAGQNKYIVQCYTELQWYIISPKFRLFSQKLFEALK